MKAPCFDCSDRYFDKERGVTCHCECTKYQNFVKEREKVRREEFLRKERQREVLRRK